MGIKISVARAYQEQEKVKEKKSKMGFEKVILNEPSEDGIYPKSLVLVRHLKI
jgi:hypothetical protein